MKKLLFGIFAHPDDEAFGPGGTLITETDAGTELHLITLTAGDAGCNPDEHEDLATMRLDEWQTAAKILGAHSTTYLGYKDGMLSNCSMIEIVSKLQKIIEQKLPDEECHVELMSFEFGGISGHIDHIVAARAAAHVFYMQKQTDSRFQRLRLFCVPRERQPEVLTNWLFMDQGIAENCIDETVDVSAVYKRRVAAIRAHASQRADGEFILKKHVDIPEQVDHFIIRN